MNFAQTPPAAQARLPLAARVKLVQRVRRDVLEPDRRAGLFHVVSALMGRSGHRYSITPDGLAHRLARSYW